MHLQDALAALQLPLMQVLEHLLVADRFVDHQVGVHFQHVLFGLILIVLTFTLLILIPIQHVVPFELSLFGVVEFPLGIEVVQFLFLLLLLGAALVVVVELLLSARALDSEYGGQVLGLLDVACV